MKIGTNIYWQTAEQSVLDVASELGSDKKSDKPYNLFHIVNWFDHVGDKILDVVQSTTLATLQASSQFAVTQKKGSNIDLVSITLAEDINIVPKCAGELLALDQDSRSLECFKAKRKLPLVFDLIERTSDSQSFADYLIYTNSDICLQADFYVTVIELLKLGFDSLIINRRTIDKTDKLTFSPLASAEIGKVHPGLDCFVFPRKWVKRFTRSDAVTGAGQCMRGLLLNMVAHADNMLVLTNANLTYHYGDDRPWTSTLMKEYENHNKKEAKYVYDTLSKNHNFKVKLNDLFDVFSKYKPI